MSCTKGDVVGSKRKFSEDESGDQVKHVVKRARCAESSELETLPSELFHAIVSHVDAPSQTALRVTNSNIREMVWKYSTVRNGLRVLKICNADELKAMTQIYTGSRALSSDHLDTRGVFLRGDVAESVDMRDYRDFFKRFGRVVINFDRKKAFRPWHLSIDIARALGDITTIYIHERGYYEDHTSYVDNHFLLIDGVDWRLIWSPERAILPVYRCIFSKYFEDEIFMCRKSMNPLIPVHTLVLRIVFDFHTNMSTPEERFDFVHDHLQEYLSVIQDQQYVHAVKIVVHVPESECASPDCRVSEHVIYTQLAKLMRVLQQAKCFDDPRELGWNCGNAPRAVTVCQESTDTTLLEAEYDKDVFSRLEQQLLGMEKENKRLNASTPS